ncbi:MAG: SGNH/GDSL hydrolase family protein [Acutalibacteraceae bacterium]
MYIKDHAMAVKSTNKDGKWIAGWGTSPVDFYISLKDYLKKDISLFNVLKAGTTTRTEFTVTASGKMIRLYFSNEYGKTPVTIDAVSIARTEPVDTACIIGGTTQNVTFDGGKTSLTISAGETVVSDEIEFPTSALEKLSVSMFFKNQTVVNTSGLYSAVTYLSNKVRYPQINKSNLRSPKKLCLSSGSMACNLVPFFCGIDVLSESKDAYSIVMFGDSTFCNDAFIHLTERIIATGHSDISVVNKAISGNKLLNRGYGLIGNFYGDSAVTRFSRDVLGQSGVKAVIVKIGINDITHPNILSMKGQVPIVSVQEMIDAYTLLAKQAHENGIRIFLSKIAPWNGYERNFLGKKGDLTWTKEQYDFCCELNRWIENNDICDGFIETDELADPNDITRLYKPFTTDCMHFSPLGAIAFSDIIDLPLLGIDGEAPMLIDTKYRYFPREMNLRTEESGDFGEQFEQIRGFISQMTDHMKLKMRK